MLTNVHYVMCFGFGCMVLVTKHENCSISLQSVQNTGVLYAMFILKC